MTATATTETAHAAGGRKHAGGSLRFLNFGTGILGGAIVAGLTWLIAKSLFDPNGTFYSDRYTTVTYIGWVVGFLAGMGAFHGPLNWMLGRDLDHGDEMYLAGKDLGNKRYWKYCTDHKVVGVQYLILTMVILGVGGTLAMLIRFELMRPGVHWANQQVYNSLIGMHGILMIVGMIIAVAGPWGNFVMPIMVGGRDMAFPRLNALSLWTIVAAVFPFLSIFLLGGIQDGWSTYAPLSVQSEIGMDAFAVAIITFVISATVAGVNMVCTFVTMRTKGMKFDRMPIFAWGTTIGSALGLYAMPFFAVAMAMMLSDRAIGTTFFQSVGGGTGWLWANMFWLMGHPEVYVILLPAVAAVMEIATVFARKPLFGYHVAVAGFLGIAGLSVIVWAHHMFTTGWAPALGGPFMLTTELISIPTGIVFLVLVGTLWQGKIWMRLPMYYVFGFVINFMIGGITGIYLSDIPVDNQMHGTMFVVAHFHYVFAGSVLIGALGAVAFWFPKVTGRFLDERLGKISFWIVFLGINVTFMSMFVSGLAGMPRRIASYSVSYATTNMISSIAAFVIFAGFLVELYAIIYSWRNGKQASSNPWHSKTLEWQVPTPVPLENFEVLPVVTRDPYGYGEDAEAAAHTAEPVGAHAGHTEGGH